MTTPRRPRGQVLVLACIVFMTCALMLMASFSISNAVHERIRIQAAADAHAFSVALLEARAFNTVAFMNRAIAGGIVGGMALHAWRAIAARDIDMYKAGSDAFLIVAAVEFGQCPPYNWIHCKHGAKAMQISQKFKSKGSQARNQLESKDRKWRDAVKGFNDMIKQVNSDQKTLLDRLKGEIGPSSATLANVVRSTAPRSSIVNVSYNQTGLACAVEGSNFDGDCQKPSWKNVGSKSSASDRSKIMESAARAARPDYEAGKSLNGAGMIARSLSADDYRTAVGIPVVRNPRKAMDIQGDGDFIETPMANGDKEVADINNGRLSGKVSKALVAVKWQDGFGVAFTNGSSLDTSNEFKGVPCDGSGGCFINFRLSTEKGETDMGQPTTYGAITQDLRQRRGGGARPWEINGRGSVRMPGSTSGARFTFVPSERGTAVAKGKTYFHQLGQWSTPPNLFDPFWRPKLHPFVRAEMASVLQMAGDRNGADLIRGGHTAVEGRIQ